MPNQTLPEGIRFFDKNDKAPEFVLGTLVISLNDLVKFCKDNPALLTDYKGAKQLKLQLLKSKAGKTYLAVDSYKAGEAAPTNDEKLPF